jgi:hypothetical protein
MVIQRREECYEPEIKDGHYRENFSGQTRLRDRDDRI